MDISNRFDNTRAQGSEKEEEAKKYLQQKGYQILTSNFRCKMGEIDLIARDGKYLVFVEVKYRSSGKAGLPQEAVDIRKQRRIVLTAKYYMMLQGISEFSPCRFDVVVMTPEHVELIQNAFEAF